MHPRVGRHGKQSEVRTRRAADQARPAAPRARPGCATLLAGCGLLLAGCADGVPKDIDPRYWWRNLSGAYLDGREPPPGRDAPYPNLATVPARPVPPSAAERAALTAALAAQRDGAAQGLVTRPVGPPAAGLAGRFVQTGVAAAAEGAALLAGVRGGGG
ncbi:hypothetical protein HEQ75_11455, partial [Roseomonas sp. BU-1]|nr:hypothetical protein [Falsiroseomonas selenitidurans]